MSASNNNQKSSSNSNASTTMSLTGMTINSLGINKRDNDQISRIVFDESLGADNSKRRKLSCETSIAASQNHHFHHVRKSHGRKRPLSPELSPPVIKPCNYLMKIFQNKGTRLTSCFAHNYE